jgi:hypothetical protein
MTGRMERYFSYEDRLNKRKPEWSMEENGILTRAWIGRYSDCAGYNFWRRDVYFRVTSGETTLAAGTLIFWKGDYTGDRDLLGYVYAADNLSSSDYEAALAVARIWGTEDDEAWWTDDPFCYGSLCVFERLVIAARKSVDVHNVWQAIEALLHRLRRGLAVIILKAFPLEYERNVTDANDARFRQRQRALIRLYRRRLKMEPAPHQELFAEGWMMRLMKEAARPDVREMQT